MADLRARLVRCFAATFPKLSEDQIATASTETVAGWDSVGSVTLFATIEEEFEIELDIGDMADLLSFAKVFAYLQSKGFGS